MRERLRKAGMWPPAKPTVPKRSARYYFRHTEHLKALEVSLLPYKRSEHLCHARKHGLGPCCLENVLTSPTAIHEFVRRAGHLALQ